MNNQYRRLSRRKFLQVLALLGSASAGMPLVAQGSKSMLMKAIPSSGEKIPVIGMGSSGTFEVGDNQKVREKLTKVLQTFFDQGGTVIDTSPMYGSSEQVLGELLVNVQNTQFMFMATKVWTQGKKDGIAQMQRSMALLRRPILDLIQIHNLLDWETHWKTLKQWKQQGKVRYVGITTHRGYDHDQLAYVMENYPIDFIQFSYSIANRKAEQRILPLAAERGIATMVNRPFQRGDLFRSVKGKDLPALAADIDCNSWGQFFLKFVVSHPAVTCTIPATSKVHHMQDNMGAGFGRMPGPQQRQQMLDYYESL